MGKKATMRGDQHQRQIDVLEAHPDQDQRRDRHHRRHLQDHGIGIERALEQPALAEQDGQRRRPRPGGDESLPGSRSGWTAATPSATRNCRAKRARDGRWARAAHRAGPASAPRAHSQQPSNSSGQQQRQQNVEQRASCRHRHVKAPLIARLGFDEWRRQAVVAARAARRCRPRCGRGAASSPARGRRDSCFPSRCG